MNKDDTINTFLKRNNLDFDSWTKANIKWEILEEIAQDYIKESANLENTAKVIANAIQKFPNVHSVRWRIKESDHLLAKIIRKRAIDNLKYKDISKENYLDVITDLIGVRALHLFKREWEAIDESIRVAWTLFENPKAYIRIGDSELLQESFKFKEIDIEEHSASYRSIHYVIASTPFKRKINAEIQVRTIFEEGWSEIDHKVKYPNYSNNSLVIYFLEIFNRMAGSADDMGGFVIGLVETLHRMEGELIHTKVETENTIRIMENALAELEREKAQNNESKTIIEQLKEEVTRQKFSKDLEEQNKNHLTTLAWGVGFPGLASLAGLPPRSIELLTKAIDKKIPVPKSQVSFLTEFMKNNPSQAQRIKELLEQQSILNKDKKE